MSPPPVLVIGGGVAGSACALALRNLGIDVHLAEKAEFPRPKVCGCCIGGVGLHWLQRLSQRDWVVESGVATRRWVGSIGGQLIELALPAGVAISRQKLDTGLLEAARDAGATVSMPCHASIDSLADDAVTARLMTDRVARTLRCSAVVVAAGLNASGLQDILPWKETPNGPFGVACSGLSASIEPGVIYMVCDDDGYVGLVKLENDRVDIAAALSAGAIAASRGTPRQRIESMLERSEFPTWTFEDESPMMTTPPLRRTRAAGAGRVLAIGDAAGYVEPFTGEGMTWAMQSGIAAAETIADSMGDLSNVGQAWDRRQRGLLGKQKLACRAVTRSLRWSVARRAAAAALTRWPSLAKPLIHSLNAG